MLSGKSSFNILLCVPPDYDPIFPPLGTPALCAFLKKDSFDCVQTDLNLKYRDFLASYISADRNVTSAEKRLFLKPALEKFFTYNLAGKYYSDLLPRHGDGFFPTLPYSNNTNSSFYFTERLLSSKYLFRYLDDRCENTFYKFYEDCRIISKLREDSVKLLGISIISPTQAVASLTLARLIKKNLPDIHITIGGQWVTLFRNVIIRKKELFDCFDSAIPFEGERPLSALAKAIRDKGDISVIPNIILRETDRDAGADRKEWGISDLPCPDFTGLNLGEYDGSRDGTTSLTYETSRGCYWSKCAYCVDLPIPKPSYRWKDPRFVARDMKELGEKYGAKYLLFGDPGLAPRQMRAISERMIESGVKMELWTMARLDNGFDRELFDLAYRAGFRQINFGFESANDRVCGFLDKGNKRERSSRIIKDCANAGIKVDLQTMLGLPGESFEDALDTIDFLIEHKDYISHATFNTYYLTPFNYVYDDPARYGIEFDRNTDLPFRFFIPFKNIKGIDMDKAKLLEGIYHTLVKKGDHDESDTTEKVSYGSFTFSINGEKCTVWYKYYNSRQMYSFAEENNMTEKEPILV